VAAAGVSPAGSSSNLKAVRCGVCGALQSDGGSSSSCMQHVQQGAQQPPWLCKVCGRPLQSGGSNGAPPAQQLPGVSEITADEEFAAVSSSSSSSRSQLARGWWARVTAGISSSGWGSKGATRQQQPLLGSEGATAAAGGSGFAGSLQGAWGPPLRPSNVGPDAAAGSSVADAAWLARHVAPQWRLSTRDASIGRCVMQAGELVFVLRPLVYVVLLKRYGLTSWKPWLTSLALDLASGGSVCVCVRVCVGGGGRAGERKGWRHVF
jgi:hypothetical protein